MPPNLDLYTDQTPNGVKSTITLEELDLPYNVHHIDISTNEQKEPWFLAINPNGRIPALTDVGSDGQEIRLFESGSLMLYLIEHYDPEYKISYQRGSREYHEMLNWLFFQNAGVGPMQGQSNHFTRYATEKIEYGINRYQTETRRLYRVLDNHLKETDNDYLVGNKFTIADIAHFGWVAWAGWAGVDNREFEYLKKWEERCAARPAVEKGRNIPTPDKLRDILSDPKKTEEYAQHHTKWIQKGMKDDSA
ncbi:theta class glutathione S-transferase [Pseudovirgaria hyperparasitica]|uniref:Theta class glutathione S-transferase n=1 Tax=Pseudovirgaria hyperparasitica TaxID=470096 RepID=A0A6A6W5Z4_9PEZI|nr:theta class glutathione S-transferase [Pseudovirgaria hyperparasitica]KAF2758023.1 theta class glutathione S-transferase [Pseudovirgaria hyperparasitica]